MNAPGPSGVAPDNVVETQTDPRSTAPAADAPETGEPAPAVLDTAQMDRVFVEESSTGSVLTQPIARRWQRLYAIGLAITDAAALIWVVFGTQIAWIGIDSHIAGSDSLPVTVSYTLASTVLVILWVLALSLNDSRSFRVTGVGFEEYRRVIQGSFVLFAWIAIVAYLLQWQIARGYLLISLPAGIAVLMLTRWLWRQWLNAKRQHGDFSQRVLLVGSEASALHVAKELARSPHAGYHVIAACVPGRAASTDLPGTNIPVIGDLDGVPAAIERSKADTVVITGADELPPERVKQISWSLEQGRRHLVVAPGLTDIAGPRIHTRPVAGLPLIHVETPVLSAGQRILKRTTDIVLSSVLIVLLSPVFIALALIVKLTSPGPVLYRSERIGRGGEPFHMLKFRSMRVGADKQLKALLEAQGTAQKPLFKVQNDPRITPIGRVLRKYSLDELPQLFNVLGGSMSLIGPRPQIAAEVALYTDAHRRRLMMRPGITGLWQVSGRSTLDWEQAVRLDLYYIENWSLPGDILILFKTVKAVVSPGETAH
jgi:exopolysaccharide biosynthesis polyprenyl glycosylphosphotransferase